MDITLGTLVLFNNKYNRLFVAFYSYYRTFLFHIITLRSSKLCSPLVAYL